MFENLYYLNGAKIDPDSIYLRLRDLDINYRIHHLNNQFNLHLESVALNEMKVN